MVERKRCVCVVRAHVFFDEILFNGSAQFVIASCYPICARAQSCIEDDVLERLMLGLFWLTMKLFLMLIVIVILVAASAPDPVIPH